MDYETAMFDELGPDPCPNHTDRHGPHHSDVCCYYDDELEPTPGPSLAHVMEAIAARRDQTHGGQLSLPDEFMPTPAGQLFA